MPALRSDPSWGEYYFNRQVMDCSQCDSRRMRRFDQLRNPVLTSAFLPHNVPAMRRLPTILLSLVVLFSGLAQAFDLHDQSGCADTSNPTLSEPATPASGDAPDLHAAGCCFGSMVLTLPAANAGLHAATITLADGSETARPPTWHSDSPERPPRS